SWTLQAVRHVCQGDNKVSEDELLEQLETLIDHSLVQRTPLDDDASKVLRFHLLETIRDYGKGWLDANGEREDLQRRHAIYYLKQAQQLEVPLSSRKLLAIVFKLSYDQANLRTALSWFVEHHEAELAQQMCAALGRYWEAGSNFQEARHWMDLALAMPEETPPATRARLLKAVARITQWEMDWERSLACAREALTLYEATNDDAGKAWALFHIGDVSHMQGHYRVAINYFEESLYLFHVQEDWVSYAFTLSRLGATATMLGSYDQAELWLKEALAQHRALRKQGWLTLTVISLGVVAILQGNLAQSTAYLKEGLWLAQQTGNRYMLALDLIVFGCLIGTSSGAVYAARICSGAEELFAQIKTMLPPSYHLIYHTHLFGLKAQVDTATWDKWWAEGKLLSADELIELALKMTEEEDSR
ncbi:MAG TPA: tetratricopeptide repeat protein, partial [Ktedonobacteraceae bacterium]|nr:tetratricopeptide repeat protein [Ktedonobacteraceae bacterium]